MRKLLLSLVVLLSSVTVFADGDLRLVMKNSWSFSELKLHEQGGQISGAMKGLGGESPVQMTYSKDMITLEWMGSKTYIHARRWDGAVNFIARFQDSWLDFDAGLDKKTKTWNFWGKSEMSQDEVVNYRGSASDSRGETYIEWEDQLLILKKTPAKGAGSFEGFIKSQGGGEEKMTFFGDSSGSLLDALFNNPDLIYTWLVGYFI